MKRRPFVQIIAILLLGVTAVSCRAEPAPPPAITPTPPPMTLRLGLSDSARPLADLVAVPYAAHTDRARLQFIPGNNDALFADLGSGQLDALLVHHIPEGNESWFNPVALDGLVLVVHPDNAAASITLAQAQAIFSGRFTDWTAVNGPEQSITLISRERGAGSRAILAQRVLGAQRLSINALLQPDDEGVLTAVAADPAAVGYSMMAAARTAEVKLLAIEGVSPTPVETGSQNYPLTTPLYFVAPAEPEGELRAFLAWLQSADGQSVLGDEYGRVR